MAVRTIGIMAHVDAGKTTLTERILFETGCISTLGSVDKGTTQTDTLPLERARGITIQAAVAAFTLGNLDIALIDTPGHADFIAEVERSLRVVDTVVLVVSAVEGVQPQTVALARAVQALQRPLLIFVNKIDRMGARPDAVLGDLEGRLGVRIAPMNRALNPGEPHAGVAPYGRCDVAWRDRIVDLLADLDDRIIEAFDRSDGQLADDLVHEVLRDQIGRGAVVPVYCGSARTGAGVDALLDGIAEWSPPASDRDWDTPGARCFKIRRNARGEKLVYARVESGTFSPRQRVSIDRGDGSDRVDERITAIDRFVAGSTRPTDLARTGDIVILHGVRAARIGDWMGDDPPPPDAAGRHFTAPRFESLVTAADPAQANALHAALDQLAEQDPLIGLRVAETGVSVSIYGEVQKEVLTDTLRAEYGVEAMFGPNRIVCIERVTGSGDAVEIIGSPENPYPAGLGFRVEAGPAGSGIRYERELGSLPLAWYRVIEETVFAWLEQGLYGWPVTDCVVTLHSLRYWSPVTVAGDFRRLAPLPLFAAVRQAGTIVCEPVDELVVDLPVDAIGGVVGVLTNARASIGQIDGEGESRQLTCEIPTAELRAVEHQLPRLTGGEGSWAVTPAGYRPVDGPPPIRARTGPNPLVRDGYLGDVARG